MQVEARVASFYRNLPKDVAKTLTKNEWLNLARFIENKLAEIAQEDSYILDNCDTKLPRLVVIDPVNHRGLIRLSTSEVLEYDPNAPKLIKLYGELKCLEELNKMHLAKFIHQDVKPPCNICSEPEQNCTLPVTDYDFAYSEEELKSSLPSSVPTFVDPPCTVAPPPTPRDSQK